MSEFQCLLVKYLWRCIFLFVEESNLAISFLECVCYGPRLHMYTLWGHKNVE